MRRPALRIRYSSSANSLAVSSILRPAALHLVLHAIQLQVGHLQNRFDRRPAPPQQGAYTGGKLGVRERLVHAIVGSAIQCVNPVFDPRTGGEHEDRQLRLAGPHAAQHGDAVEFWEVQVENKEVIIEIQGHECALLPIERHIDRIMFGFQSLTNVGGKRRIVFYQKDTHTSGLPSILLRVQDDAALDRFVSNHLIFWSPRRSLFPILDIFPLLRLAVFRCRGPLLGLFKGIKRNQRELMAQPDCEEL